MTLHDDTVALRHMRDHVAEAIELAGDRQRDDLDVDRVFALALNKPDRKVRQLGMAG